MRPNRSGVSYAAWAVLLLSGSMILTGCQTHNPMDNSRSLAVSHSGVSVLPGRDRVQLDADDIVGLMSAAGFTHAQILELGPDVRNALATAGGANITISGKVEAICVAEPNRILVSSQLRGSLIYPLKSAVTAK